MVEDPLGIFKEIKKVLTSEYKGSEVYAFGSRVKGVSAKGKWDFDVILLWTERLCPFKVKERLMIDLANFKDEFNRKVVVDVFTSTLEHRNNILDGAIML